MADQDIPLDHEWVPPREGVDGNPPAVVVLHGRGADERDLLPVAGELPDELAVVSFRAPEPLGPGYTWYELDLAGGGLHSSQPDEADFRRSLDLVTASVEGAVDTYGIDPDGLGLFGFSQGAVMSFSLLLEAPERYAWCVGLHGYLASVHSSRDPPGIDGVPVFIGAGSRDEVIPPERSERAVERLRAIGADVTFRTYEAGHGIGYEALRDVVDWVGRIVTP